MRNEARRQENRNGTEAPEARPFKFRLLRDDVNAGSAFQLDLIGLTEPHWMFLDVQTKKKGLADISQPLVSSGAQRQNRTADTRIFSPLLEGST